MSLSLVICVHTKHSQQICYRAYHHVACLHDLNQVSSSDSYRDVLVCVLEAMRAGAIVIGEVTLAGRQDAADF